MKTDPLAQLRTGAPLTTRQQMSLTLQLSWPAIMAQLATIIMQYIDAAMVGRLGAAQAAAVGLVAVFCGAVNCPIASVFLSIELFGTGDLLYFAMACAISYLLSGYCGLYSSQTILYSKMRAEFINIHTNENEEKHG